MTHSIKVPLPSDTTATLGLDPTVPYVVDGLVYDDNRQAVQFPPSGK